MAKILTDNWQITENLTDYWHLPWVLLSTDKGPDCPLFSTKLVLKALNSIVPLFSSYNVIKCAFLGVILAARRLKSHVCHAPSANDLWFQIYVSVRTRQHTMAAQNEGVTKAIASFYWDDWETVFLVFLRATSQYHTCQLFLSQMSEIFTLSWPRFPETSRQLPKISDELPKTSGRCRKLNVRRCSRRSLSSFEAT